MKWQKLGLIFRPDGQRPWIRSHATSPFALALGGNRYRIYFSSRDDRNRAHMGFIEIDINHPERVMRLSEYPILAPGPLGYFDDHGVYGRCLVENSGRQHLFYLGWNRGADPLFYSSIGLAVSSDGGETFQRYSQAPIIERSSVDPWCVLLPAVRLESERWRMWYASGLGWKAMGDKQQSIYHIKYAESDDGLTWRRNGHVCIELEPGETNLAHPCVVREADGYTMWYSRNSGAAYRIGRASSRDGLIWRRCDAEAGIDVSTSGWDSEMICQPFVFVHGDRRYMLYNGNGYGRDGIGFAVEIQS